jgi:site-specific DNA-methyltransferase (adenine-specific)
VTPAPSGAYSASANEPAAEIPTRKTPVYEDDRVTLHHGDCLDVMRTLPDASVDAVVTDPPYDLTAGKKGGTGVASVNLDSPYGRSRISTGNGGFMGKGWDATGVAFDPETWREALRVLKPGGHLLAFGGSRTWHRLACAVEDAGFEIRDSIAWLYGSGFPKSLDVSKALDKRLGAEREITREAARPLVPGEVISFDQRSSDERERRDKPVTPAAAAAAGWGTALKPAFEPVVVGRKPLAGTVADNWLAHGTGALNIDACRVGEPDGFGGGRKASSGFVDGYEGDGFVASEKGRWPTNVALEESQAAELDRQSGTLNSGANPTRRGADGERTVLGTFAGQEDANPARGADSGGASRFFPIFRYEAKAPTDQRPRDGDVAHPTVKPLDLMRWLVRLVTPPGGTVLEPFAGSGTTAEACVIEGFRCIAIEREATYLPLIVARLSKPIQPDLFGGAA